MKRFGHITKEILIKEYNINKQSIQIIAKKFKCTPMTIFKKLKKYNIKRRTAGETNKLLGYFKGKKNPMYHKHSPNYKGIKYFCKKCKKEISYKHNYCKSCVRKGIKRKSFSKEHRKNMSLARGGNGIPYSNRIYNIIFYMLRKIIRQRDNYECAICHKKSLKRALAVHHIDYNKQNNHKINLISLCQKCHLKTNWNRTHWINYFKYIIRSKY